MQLSWRAMDCGHSPDHYLQKRRLGSPGTTHTGGCNDNRRQSSSGNRGQPRHRASAGRRSPAQRRRAGTCRYAPALAHPDGRVTPLRLDVTNTAQIQAAAEQVEGLDLLINNAGVFLFDDLSDRAGLERHLAVNLFGTYGVTRAFLPCGRGRACGSMPSFPAPPTPIWSETSTSPRPPRSRSRARSWTAWSGGGGHLPRSHVTDHGRQLAQRCGQDARTPERGARSSARRDLSNGRTLIPCSSRTCRLRRSPGHR
jgi:short chain dehydrogenase